VDLTYKKDAPDNVTVIAARIGDAPGTISTTLIGAAQ